MDWLLQFLPLVFYLRCLYLSVCPSVLPSVRPCTLPCPPVNSSHIWARSTEFAPNMHPWILFAGVEKKGHWSWPSRSFWPFWLRILGNSTCSDDNLSHFLARLTKFALNMHPGILLCSIETKGHWPWHLRSFWPFHLRILGNLACSHNNLKWIKARIIKFSPNMHLENVLTGIAYGGH